VRRSVATAGAGVRHKAGYRIDPKPKDAHVFAPSFIGPARFDDPAAALRNCAPSTTRACASARRLQRFVSGETLAQHVRLLPFVRVHTDTVARADSRLSYGFVAGPGTYETTLTRPDLFGDYYFESSSCC